MRWTRFGLGISLTRFLSPYQVGIQQGASLPQGSTASLALNGALFSTKLIFSVCLTAVQPFALLSVYIVEALCSWLQVGMLLVRHGVPDMAAIVHIYGFHPCFTHPR